MKNYILAIGICMLFINASCENKDKGLGADEDEIVVLHTNYGSLSLLLYEETPLHKENFLKLAKEGKFDSTIFHRVIKNFMIQGGDVNRKDPLNPLVDYTIPAEIVPQFLHEKGALAAARLGDQQNPTKASSGSQFYIVQGKVFTDEDIANFQNERTFGYVQAGLMQLIGREEYAELRAQIIELQRNGEIEALQALIMDQKSLVEGIFGEAPTYTFSEEQIAAYTTKGGAPHLDGAYTVFGRVLEGLELVDLIANQPTKQADQPVEDVKVWMEIQRIPKAEITAKYGYVYPEKDELNP